MKDTSQINSRDSAEYYSWFQDQEKQLEIAHGICKNFYNHFNNPRGMEIMDYLKSKTVDLPTWTPEKGHDYGYFREGQNSVYRLIFSNIEHGKNLSSKENEA